ncbi:MAG: putative porin [Bacteroidales bacterium]
MNRLAGYMVLVVTATFIFAGAEAQSTDRTMRQYRLAKDFTSTVTIDIDTAFTLAHRVRKTDRYSAFNAYPGNYGLPLYQINYFDRTRNPDHFLYQYYYPFMYTPGSAIFMDVQVPYTELLFTYAGPAINKAEQTFRVRHSHNISRYLNFGLIYDIVYSLGQYSHQKADNKNFILHASMLREKYRFYAALGINNLNSNENGGVVNSATIGQFDTRDVPVRLGGLNMAISTLRNRSFLLVQKYSPTGFNEGASGEDESGLVARFSHIFIGETNTRNYFDASPGSGFYDTVYVETLSATNDSLRAILVSNTLRGDFGFRTKGGFELIAGGGIKHEYHNHMQMIPVLFANDSIGQGAVSWNHHNVAVIGRIENRIGSKFGWQADGTLFFGGNRTGDLEVTGEAIRDFNLNKGKSELALRGGFSRITPSVWFMRWGSNHFKWSTDMENREFSVTTGAAYSYPGRLFEVEFNYSIIDNFTYFDRDALPAYHGGALSVAALTVDKTFRAGGFRFGTRLLLQQSSNRSVLDLPLATARGALWYDRNIHFEITGGNLHIETGVEAFIHTPYYAMAYMPATGRYYNQDTEEIGGYPFVNLFLNAKIKRTRIMLCFDHINHGFTGNNYFLLPRYPLNVRVFRYGIAWTFYD